MSSKPAAAHFTDTLTSSPDAPRAPLNCYVAVTALTMVRTYLKIADCCRSDINVE